MSAADLAADQRAARAVVGHHTELASTLAGHVRDLLKGVEIGSSRVTWVHRDELAAWLHAELLPHAHAEEATLYPAAAAQPGGKLLVEGMLGEHQIIGELVTELEVATTPVAAAAAARALQVVFAGHLAKENDLVVPLLVNAEAVSLAGLLAGMHELIGADGTPATQEEAGCGCGGCGCGGDGGSADTARVEPVLAIDPRLDVRNVPHSERHARVLAALDALPADGALVLIAPHAPRPLLAQIEDRYAGQVAAEWLQDGPEVWQIRLHRSPSAA